MHAIFRSLVLFGLFLAACSTRTKVSRFVLPAPVAPTEKQQMPQQYTRRYGKPCSDWKHYALDSAQSSLRPMRYLRVNIHVMNSKDSSQNFKQTEAKIYYKALLDSANAQLSRNWKNWRSPEGTPVMPKGYRYVLWPQPGKAGDDGFYFHYDDELYAFVSQGKHQNNYSRKVIDKYGIGTDSIINIFALVHHPDSVKSKTYRTGSQGIALGTDLKLAGPYELKWPPGQFAPSLNHEVGHILSLPHAWSEDGCPDTENHPNKCWEWTSEAPCDKAASCNMMDYNAYQIAMTPCQIARVHATLSNENSKPRKCLMPTWCVRNPDRDLNILDTVIWRGDRDVEGNITILPGGSLTLCCRVALPENAQIRVQPGGTLILQEARLHNACGKTWKGIFTVEKNGLQGKVLTEGKCSLENITGG
jgi:hypothetical protein